ncbi:hypothetical protein [Arvimicrobium flavum]|uniref:hypothetical protein n=1 Tax=Arvimicrobium flavum TaxID=3393320 RepID=UPI00237B8F41|nr:hypothetical protein [Mesorhizobium shangrilense]
MPNPYVKRTALAANTAAPVAEAPADRGLRFHVNVVNRGPTAVKLRAFFDVDNTPTDADWVEYDHVLVPGVPLREWPVVLTPGLKLYVRVDGPNCNAVAWGELDFPAVT